MKANLTTANICSVRNSASLTLVGLALGQDKNTWMLENKLDEVFQVRNCLRIVWCHVAFRNFRTLGRQRLMASISLGTSFRLLGRRNLGKVLSRSRCAVIVIVLLKRGTSGFTNISIDSRLANPTFSCYEPTLRRSFASVREQVREALRQYCVHPLIIT